MLSLLYSPTLTSIHDYWKKHRLTRWTFVGKVMSLLFNMLSRLVIAFLLRRKCLLISWLQSPPAVILEPKKIKSVTVSFVSPSICHQMMGVDAMIFVYWMLSFKPAFSLSAFTFIKRLFSSSWLSLITVVSSAYVRLLIFLLAILIPAYASSSPIFHMMYSAYKLKEVLNLEPVCCSTSSSNYCFLTCIQVSQEAGQVVWYSHLLKNFPQFVVIHTVSFWCSQWSRSRCFSGTLFLFLWSNRFCNLISAYLSFLNPAWTSGISWFTYCWSLAWRILSITLLVCEMSAIVW